MTRRDGYVKAAKPKPSPLTEYPDITQGTPEWDDLRRGIVTASIVARLITGKTLAVAHNDESRGLTATLVAERITGHTDPTWQSNDMLRGQIEEPIARDLYSRHFAEARETGFMVRDEWGFKIGWSPDGLVGDDGAIEIKSRRQKKHLQTMLADEVPPENVAQVQCALLVSGRAWIDYVSYCGGMPLWVKRVEPNQRWHDAIVAAVGAFEDAAVQMEADFYRATKGLPATERIDNNLGLVF
jgi:hypothetical protein